MTTAALNAALTRATLASAVPGVTVAPVWPRLRGDLRLSAGPADPDGRPTYVIHDPVANRFYRIDAVAAAMLARFEAGSPTAVAARMEAETLTPTTADDVEALLRFLDRAELLEAPLQGGAGELIQRAARARRGVWSRLAHDYLFFRVPLVRPDNALAALVPWTGFLFTRGFIIALLAVLAGAVYLLVPQWDAVGASLERVGSPHGLAQAAVTLLTLKAIHELGHGLVAKRHGCRVPTMGVAFMLLVPVLYTDTTDAWRLSDRRARLMIGLAGVMAEAVVAVVALVAFVFLPDGAWRDFALLAALISVVISVGVNLNPFMRFDGYFVLMDAVGLDNLQPRAFQMAKWWWREVLFGLGEPPPERLSPARRRFLIVYGLATLVFRLVLYVGIALIVYHATFKALGILLFIFELMVFVARPVGRELATWWELRMTLVKRPRAYASVAIAAGLIGLAFLPVPTRLEIPAEWTPTTIVSVHPPALGALETIHVAEGQEVTAGQSLATLSNPAIASGRRLAELERAAIDAKLAGIAGNSELAAEAGVLRARRAALDEKLAAQARVEADLKLVAPIAGRVVDLDPTLAIGRWMAPRDRLMAVISTAPPELDALVREDDLKRLPEGAQGRFVSDDPDQPSVPVRLSVLAPVAKPELTVASLASPHGGPILADLDARGRLTALEAVFPARFQVIDPATALAGFGSRRGVITVTGHAESLATRVGRQIARVLVRESGF